MMDKNKVSKLFDSAIENNYFDFKASFKEIFCDEFDSQCNELAAEATKELARFGIVEEGISIPLPNNPNVKDAHLFAIESDDENMVVKFKVNGEEKCFKVKEEDKDFYKNLSESSMDDYDDKSKEKIAMDMNEFMNEVEKSKKDESIERGEELKSKDIKMEADMAKLKGDARLKELKKMGEKAKLAKSKEANKAMKEELESYLVDEETSFKIQGKHADGKPFTTAAASNDKSFLKDKMKELEKKGFKELKLVKVDLDTGKIVK